MWWVKLCPFRIAKFNDRSKKKLQIKNIEIGCVYVIQIWQSISIILLSANDVVSSTVKEVGKQFQQAFMVENTRKEVFKKVGELENRVNGK